MATREVPCGARLKSKATRGPRGPGGAAWDGGEARITVEAG